MQQQAVRIDDKKEARRLQILESLGVSLSAKRQQAITHRANSGIEQIWTEDEEHYMGIDDANRDELGGTVEKPTTSGSRNYNRSSGDNSEGLKSTVFPNITQPYVDAAAARIGDMLLPTDDRNFAIEPTPIPTLIDVEAKLAPPAPVAPAPPLPGANPLSAGGAPQQPPQGPPPPPPRMITMPDGSLMPEPEVRAKIAKTKEEANRRTEKAQTRIDDWLTECDYLGEVRQMLDDAAKVGTGVIKGPIPVKRQRKTWQMKGNDMAMVLAEMINPASKCVSYWNLYPDPACGEDIHRGSWIWEVDTLAEKGVKALKGLPGYLDSQLDMVLEEGPAKYTVAGKMPWDEKQNKGQFQIWYFHGTVTKDDIEAAGCECGEGATFEALITMINDHVVRAALNPLDSGEFPYDVMRWKRRPGHWAGVGVARQMRTAQRMVVAATRNLMDNAGLGAGPMIVVGRGIKPQNNIWEIKPRKIWTRDPEDEDVSGQHPSVETVVIPMLQAELTNIIQLGMKMAEDSTGLPMLLQGQQGSAPDTVGGMQILNNNGSSVLRRIARLFDNGVTNPHINRYYDWLMCYGDDPDEKGDMFIKARGSSALVERDAQTMELAQIVGMCLNPAFGKSPKKAMDEYLKSRRFDPVAFSYTEEEQAKIDSTPPPAPPQIEVAKIRAEADMAKTDKLIQADLQMDKSDTDRDLVYVQAETDRTVKEHEARMQELAVKRELAMLEYANKNKIALDQIKAHLADTALKLRTQKELAGAAGALDIHKHYNPPQVAAPAVEPPGRAPAGQAFQA